MSLFDDVFDDWGEGAVLTDSPSHLTLANGKATTEQLSGKSFPEPSAATGNNKPLAATVVSPSSPFSWALSYPPVKRRKKSRESWRCIDGPFAATPKDDGEMEYFGPGEVPSRKWTGGAKPYRSSVRAKKQPQKEPARGLTPAEMEDKFYINPAHPPEGADANWAQYTLNNMAKYKYVLTNPEDWFKPDEVKKWFNDFGPDAILNAFRSFVADKSKSRNARPLQDFRAFICLLCTGATRLESYAYSVGELNNACRKRLGIGGNNEQSPLPTVGTENVAQEPLTEKKAFDIAIEISQHLRNREHQNWEQSPGVLNLWLAHCQKHGAHEVLKAFEYHLNTDLTADQGGTPMVGFCVLGEIIIADMQQSNGDGTQKEVTSRSGYSADQPSPSELANMSPWDRAYEQALELWRKERPNLTRLEAKELFENDDNYLTWVLKFFHVAESEV